MILPGDWQSFSGSWGDAYVEPGTAAFVVGRRYLYVPCDQILKIASYQTLLDTCQIVLMLPSAGLGVLRFRVDLIRYLRISYNLHYLSYLSKFLSVFGMTRSGGVPIFRHVETARWPRARHRPSPSRAGPLGLFYRDLALLVSISFFPLKRCWRRMDKALCILDDIELKCMVRDPKVLDSKPAQIQKINILSIYVQVALEK